MSYRTKTVSTPLRLALGLLAGTALAACQPEAADTQAEVPAAVVDSSQVEAEASQSRAVIASSQDLPRFSYEIDQLPSDLLMSDALLEDYGPRLRADIESVLSGYDISDPATESGLISTLATLDLMAGDNDAVLAHLERMTELAEKPSEKYTTGLFSGTLAEAARSGRAVEDVMTETLADMPFAVVQEDIEGAKGTLEIYSENLIKGVAQSQFDDGALDRGTISNEILSTLVGMRSMIDHVIPEKAAMIAPMAAYIDANAVERPDIWADRDVDLSGQDGLSEVVVVAWDSGVDVPLFDAQLWVNPGETPNGEDDDGNGFVDDMHGIAFDLKSDKTPDLLFPMDGLTRPLDEVQGDMKGFMDVSSNIDSPDASALKAKIGSLQPAEVQPMLEDLNLYGNYSHGTHVAGIMLEGNPAARLMTARITFDHKSKPEPFLEEDARKAVVAGQETIDYFKANGARVVNMSWGGTPEDIEYTLEVNNIETDPEARRDRAYAIFEILRSGLEGGFRSAPDILFIAAAGNSDGDASFSNSYPSGIMADNLVSVGAVDQAGEETGFTSYGPTVVLHANGYEVISEVPGGDELPFSGTSMAAPNVANLAGKMLAVDPSLGVADLIAIMRDTAETTEDGRRFLIHPANALAAVRARSE
ncbi:MAG: S8 family serine peptidase [Litorimonas sp.]